MGIKILVRIVESIQYTGINQSTCTARSLHVWRMSSECTSLSGYIGSVDVFAQPLPAYLAASLPVWGIHRMGKEFVSRGPAPVVASPELLKWLRENHTDWDSIQYRIEDVYGIQEAVTPQQLSVVA